MLCQGCFSTSLLLLAKEQSHLMLSLDTLELPSESLKDQDDEPTLRGTCSDSWSQWWPFRKAILPCLEEKQGQSTNHFILCFLWTFQQHTEESLVHKGANTKLFSEIYKLHEFLSSCFTDVGLFILVWVIIRVSSIKTLIIRIQKYLILTSSPEKIWWLYRELGYINGKMYETVIWSCLLVCKCLMRHTKWIIIVLNRLTYNRLGRV